MEAGHLRDHLQPRSRPQDGYRMLRVALVDDRAETLVRLVELTGIEPATSGLQSPRSPS